MIANCRMWDYDPWSSLRPLVLPIFLCRMKGAQSLLLGGSYTKNAFQMG